MSNKELEERSMIITMRVESILGTCRGVICSVSVLSESMESPLIQMDMLELEGGTMGKRIAKIQFILI